jgi:hypothetical protein
VQPWPRAGRERLVERGEVDDADDGLVAHLDADERPVQRHAAHERARPVERVDDPADGRRPRGLALLLAEDRVVGEGAADDPPHLGLGLAVGGRQRRAVGLPLDRDAGVEVPERPLAAGQRGLDRDVEEVAERRLAHAGDADRSMPRSTYGRSPPWR